MEYGNTPPGWNRGSTLLAISFHSSSWPTAAEGVFWCVESDCVIIDPMMEGAWMMCWPMDRIAAAEGMMVSGDDIRLGPVNDRPARKLVPDTVEDAAVKNDVTLSDAFCGDCCIFVRHHYPLLRSKLLSMPIGGSLISHHGFKQSVTEC